MLRPLSMLFERTKTVERSRSPRRKAPTIRPEAEILGSRLLPATGFQFYPIAYPTLQEITLRNDQGFEDEILDTYLPGHSVDLLGPRGGDIGTLTFNSLNGLQFQGTYVGSNDTQFTASPLLGAHGFYALGNPTAMNSSSATNEFPVGPISISGTLTPQYTGTVFTWSITGSGSKTINAPESHFYTDTLGAQVSETWQVPVQESFSFSGTMTGTYPNLSFSGSLAESAQALPARNLSGMPSVGWIGAVDDLPPTNINHRFGQGEDVFGPPISPLLPQLTLDPAPIMRQVHGNLA